MKTIRIGSGAGYSGDRIEPAVELAHKGRLNYLVFECLAERTIALAHEAKLRDPKQGYDPLLVARMQGVLEPCARQKIRIISNMGAANPVAAAQRTQRLAQEAGFPQLRVAAIVGDDVIEAARAHDLRLLETGEPIQTLGDKLLSANAYLSAEPIVRALAMGADIVITGRVADPSLFLAPQIYEFGWAYDDWDRLGQGTVIGHLLECAGQVTGGYFADPGYKDVPALARLGFPIAEISDDASAVITKVEGSGGTVTAATCKEQLLYEIHDPSSYLTPDVTADFTGVTVTEDGPDRVRVVGGRGRARPETLKVSVGYIAGFAGEGQISYAGPGAVTRGRLALEIVKERIALMRLPVSELRLDLIGVDAIHGSRLSERGATAYEVRARVAAMSDDLDTALRVGNEVETLYTNGPAGGGGATKSARRVVAIYSALLPRKAVTPAIHIEENSHEAA
ncbi:MAG: acyclic terpene utilization AtuA family protein [Burkholderiaceae bacterium]|jgi:hypothetical protein